MDHFFNTCQISYALWSSQLPQVLSYMHIVYSPMRHCGHFRQNNKHFLWDCPLLEMEIQVKLQKRNEIKVEPTVINMTQDNTSYLKDHTIEAVILCKSVLKQLAYSSLALNIFRIILWPYCCTLLTVNRLRYINGCN